MIQRVLSVSLGLIVAASGVVQAQRIEGPAQVPPRGGRPGGQGGRAGRNGPPPMSPAQQAMIRQVRQTFDGVVKRELGLNDEQMRRVRQVDDKYQLQRNQLNRSEREARQGLKAALEDTASAPDQAKVDGYMSRLVQSQRQRAEILEAEQKEFSGFLTPVQRAKFFALRDQLQRRIADMRQEGRRGGPPPQD